MSATTVHENDRLGTITASSVQYGAYIQIEQNGQRVRLDPSDIEEILEAHYPAGFADE